MHGRVANVGIAFVLLGAALLAAPTFGFEMIAADRSTQIETAADSDALIGFEATDETITGRQDTATVFTLRNNADKTLTFTTDTAIDTENIRIIASDDGSGTVAPGASNDVRIECDGGGGGGTATITTTVIDASGSTLVVEGASSSTTVDYQCRGGGQPGAGFDDVSVQDVTTYTGPGDARQQVSFTPTDDLRANSQVTVDLSAAHPDGVDYTQINWGSIDVNVIQGNGEITQATQQGVITYEAGNGANPDLGGEQIVLSIGSYETTTDAGPFDAEITREDSGETGTAPFYVVGDGEGPIEDVSVDDVSPNVQPSDEATQTFSFTFGASPAGSDQFVIDLSGPQGDGVDYNEINWNGREVVVQSGDGNAWYSSSDDTIRYQASESDANGDEIVLEVRGHRTDNSGGPYTIGIFWDKYDYEGTDTFSIN